MKSFSILNMTLSLLLAFSTSALYADEDKHKHDHDHEEDKHKHETDDHHDKHDDYEQHGTHEHGVARLTLAVSDQKIEIILASPTVNVYGFEHDKLSEEDQKTVEAVHTKLKAGSTLFHPNAEAQCVLGMATIRSTVVKPSKQDHEHKHHDGNDHKHDDDHDNDRAETHSDLEFIWDFYCTQMAELKTIDVKLFSAFPKGFERIQAEWVTDKSASAAELTQDDTLKLNE